MLTLDEAITHAKEVAMEKREEEQALRDRKDFIESNERNPKGIYDVPINQCKECAAEHEQLASWLEELKRYKAQKLVIKVDYDKAHSLKEMLRYAEFGVACPDSQYKVIPLVSDSPQGEWKHIGGDEWVCSECGHVITTEGSWEKPLSIGAYYCENCGADMRGGDDE